VTVPSNCWAGDSCFATLTIGPILMPTLGLVARSVSRVWMVVAVL
jgi:hypothetical protein